MASKAMTDEVVVHDLWMRDKMEGGSPARFARRRAASGLDYMVGGCFVR